MSATVYSPSGSTVVANATTTASNVYIPSLFPVNAWYVVNSGTTPVMVRFQANLQSPVAAVYPTVGTSQLGSIINGGDAGVIILPGQLAGTQTTNGGFVSNVQVSVITSTSSANVFITPVQVPTK